MNKYILSILVLFAVTLNLSTSAHGGTHEASGAICKLGTRSCVNLIKATSADELSPQTLESCISCCSTSNSTVSMATNKVDFCGRSCKNACKKEYKRKGGPKPSPTPTASPES